MNKIHIISILISLMSLFSSCKKISHQNTQIQGLAVNLTDGNPLVGYPIHLIETEETPMPFGPVYRRLIDTQESDANGEFSFEAALKRQDRFRYTIEFDGLDEEFMGELWQRDKYDEVDGVVEVTKGQWNACLIKQVPNCLLKGAARLKSGEGPVLFDAVIKTAVFQHKIFYKELDVREIIVENDFQGYPAGNFDVIWRLSGPNGFTDTIIQSYSVGHNEKKVLRLVYGE